MSTDLKTTKEITDNVISQLESILGQTIPFLPKFFLRVIARAFAAVYVLLYKYIGFGTLQLFVDTASAKATVINDKVITPLYAWGDLVGVGLPAPATRAELTINVTVLSLGGTLNSGAQLTYGPTGVTYVTLSTIALDDVVKQVNVQAVADQQGGDGSGSIGNLQAGAELNFANPQANVGRTVTVASTVSPGADQEDDEVYRQRVKNEFRGRPQGGALADYRRWGEEPADILNVYPYADETCPGKVIGYVEAVGQPDGIPTGPQLEQVQNSVEYDQNGLATRRPVGALFQALPIYRTLFTVNVYGLADVPNVPDAEAAVTAAVNEYFAVRENFIEGLDFPPRRDIISQLGIGGTVEDVVTALGGTVSSVETYLGALPLDDIYALAEGEKAKANVTFN